MSAIIPFSGGGQASNPNRSYETIGSGDGSGTLVTGGTANTDDGAYAQLAGAGTAGVTVNAWAGFYFQPTQQSAAGSRFLAHISINGGSTNIISDIWVSPGIAGVSGGAQYYIPLQVPAGSDVRVKTRSSTTGATFKCSIIGIVANATDAPGFTTATRLTTANTTATYPATSTGTNYDVTVGTAATGWTPLIASTAAQYGAFLLIMGPSPTANPAVAQAVLATLATGANPNETPIFSYELTTTTSVAYVQRAVSPLIQKTVAASTRLTMSLQSTTAGDILSPCLYGFS